MHARSIRWGIILISIGSLWLMARMDIVSDHVFWRLLSLWPLLLIAWGIEVIFRKTKASAVAYLSPALIGLAIAVVTFFDWQYAGAGAESGASYRKEMSADVSSLNAVIDLAGFDVAVEPGDTRSLSARFHGFGRQPEYSYSVASGVGNFAVAGRKDFWRKWDWDRGPIPGVFVIDGDGDLDWGNDDERRCVVRIPSATPLDLSVTGEEGVAELDLVDLALRSLTGSGERVRLRLRLGSKEPLVHIKLGGVDNRLRLEAPTGAGLRVTGAGYESYLRELGLEDQNGVFVTPGYDSLTPKINIDLDDDLAGLSVGYY